MTNEKHYKSKRITHINNQPMPASLGKIIHNSNLYTCQHTHLVREQSLWTTQTTIRYIKQNRLSEITFITPAEYEGYLRDIEIQIALQPHFPN